MRAALITSVQGPPAPGEFDAPQPDDGQVATEVVLARAADGEAGRPFPHVAGSEGLARFGDGRAYFDTTVWPHGAIAERTLLEPERLLPVPDGLDDADALTLAAGIGVWMAITRVRGGERVLVLGATSVAGQLAAQAAKVLGAEEVIAVGDHVPTLIGLLDRGAADVTISLDDDVEDRLDQTRGTHGFHVVVDLVGGPALEAARHHLHERAQLIRPHDDGAPPEIRRDAFETMAEHARAGQLSVPVDRYALDDVGRAWAARCDHRAAVIDPRGPGTPT